MRISARETCEKPHLRTLSDINIYTYIHKNSRKIKRINVPDLARSAQKF